jgi:hypothetical protein
MRTGWMACRHRRPGGCGLARVCACPGAGLRDGVVLLLLTTAVVAYQYPKQ